MELLVRAVLNSGAFPGFLVFGDNTGVVEGWWAGRSRNTETNRIFRRIHELLKEHDSILKTKYVNTKFNPADGPSRGRFPPTQLPLPPIDLPKEVRPFLVNFNAPLHSSEEDPSRRLTPISKSNVSHSERLRHNRAGTIA